jgi:hypothetical protein
MFYLFTLLYYILHMLNHKYWMMINDGSHATAINKENLSVCISSGFECHSDFRAQ